MKRIVLFNLAVLIFACLAKAGTASRSMFPSIYTPGKKTTVVITVWPEPSPSPSSPSVLAYGVEENPPIGWTPVITDNYNGKNAGGVLKWGVFTDNQPRTFIYTVIAPKGNRKPVVFNGRVSFNGSSDPISGTSVYTGR